MKRTGILVSIMVFGLGLLVTSYAYAQKKKVLYVDSYHPEYIWSADITRGVESVLSDRKDIELKIFRMDTKRNQSEEYKQASANKARKLIASWKPDVVIASDDNASKYLIAPYFIGEDLPFVFCGLNWDAGVYGFPSSNITGMIEIELYQPMIDALKKFAKGNRIGFLSSDTVTERKNLENIVKRYNTDFNTRFARTFDELKQGFLDLQRECDMVLIRECRSVKSFDHHEMVAFVNANTLVPTGAMEKHIIDYAMITFSKIGEEQGEYAAETALAVLAGRSPGEIPIVANKKARIYLNMKLAKKLGIKFPIELIENAHLISAEQKKLLFVNSYHKGYKWSDDLEKGLLKSLGIKTDPDGTFDVSNSNVTLKIFRMNTKLNTSEEYKQQAAISAKAIIEEWQPDIVVASDDNAAKYLIVPYYMNAPIPIVFCGLNWDATVYGLPVPNVTGMVEIAPVLETIAELKKFAKGDRIGYIGADTLTERKSLQHFKEILKIDFSDGKLVDNFGAWKKEYLRLQDSVDMLMWLGPIGIQGWNDDEAIAFIHKHTKIPSGVHADDHAPYALIGRTKIAEEQGWWAGKTAIRVLDGTAPADIPVATNKESLLFLNMGLARHLGIKFPMELLENAFLVEELPGREKVQ